MGIFKKAKKQAKKAAKKAVKKGKKVGKKVAKAQPKALRKIEKKAIKKGVKVAKKGVKVAKKGGKAVKKQAKGIKKSERGRIFGANLIPTSGSVSQGVKLGGHQAEKQQIFNGFHPQARPHNVRVVHIEQITKHHPQHKIQSRSKSIEQTREHPHFGRSSRVGRPQ